MTGSEPVRVRRATEKDAVALLEWRNDPVTRAMSLNRDPVPLAQHLAWYRAALADPRRIILVAEEGGVPVGMCRFDVDEDAGAEVSINLAPEQRGRGRGRAVLDAGLRALAAARPDVRSVIAVIRPENVASVRLFTAAGFRLRGSGGGVVRYALDLA